MIKIIDLIDIVDDLLLIDDVNVGLNDVKNANSINDVNIVTNANNNYFYCVNDIRDIKDIKYIIDILDILDNEEKIIDDVNRMIYFDHSYKTKQLTKLINSSYDRGRFQEQYLFWLPASKMASGSLIPCFLVSRCDFEHFGAL